MARFLSNILLPFPNSNDLNCCSTGTNQNFIIGCWYFLKKRKLSVRTKTLLFLAGFFLVVFVSLWHCSHVFFLPIKWWWFNIFLFFVLWDLGVVVVLNPKSTRVVTHFLNCWGITISLNCMQISVRFLGEWLEVSTRGFIKDDVCNGRLHTFFSRKWLVLAAKYYTSQKIILKLVKTYDILMK